jgi:hypothetical protein
MQLNQENYVARVIIEGQSVPIELALLGNKFTIYKFKEGDLKFSISRQDGERSIDVTNPEASELEQDIQSVEVGAKTLEEVENKWDDLIGEFLSSL